ncbi:MAG: 4-hydroxy-tetrahydrodipicolinate synthase [Clostridiales bacterium]|jgi:4-hydroxy-tetrahydrodipicolinate synthase|nr:4-hydroxy-tetrahydrodipicolinate synthase [Clostridiales bacterium]
MNKFGRVLLPLITPFDEKEEVNYQAFEELIHYVIDKDYCDTLIITGTTGEFNTLTFDEKVKLYQTAVKVVNGRKPIIAGTGCASTKETIALTKAAADIGIDTCMIVAPYYCKPTQEAIYEHYMEIANNTDINILLYNIPIFTGVNIDPKIVGKLAENKKFIGIKDEAGINPFQVTDYYFATNDANPNFLIFNGDDLMLMPTISQNAIGIVSGGAHLVGDKIKNVFVKYYDGKVEEALNIYREIFPLFRVCGINGRIHPNPMLRAAIEVVTGIKVGKPRRPLNGITTSEKEALMNVLKELKLV